MHFKIETEEIHKASGQAYVLPSFHLHLILGALGAGATKMSLTHSGPTVPVLGGTLESLGSTGF